MTAGGFERIDPMPRLIVTMCVTLGGFVCALLLGRHTHADFVSHWPGVA